MPRRVLIVDDSAPFRMTARALLEARGYAVAGTAADGASALDAAAELRPDAVLLDVNLPDMSGFQVYEELTKRWPGLPVIFSTGHADARALGEVHHRNVPSIMKPYDIDELLAVVSRPDS